MSEVPTLVDIVLNFLIRNTQSLTDLGDIEEKFKQKIYAHCSADKLEEFEKYASLNGRKLDTEPFWQNHCKLKFNVTTKKKRSWKQTYLETKLNNKRKQNLFKQQLIDAEQKERKATVATAVINKGRAAPSSKSSGFPGGWRREPTSNLPPLLKKSLASSQSKQANFKRIMK
eukprot:TRINITY_DN25275_c0_g1_i1.p1 TRINITY_DN25275_c0_g1~~TRINITY_DN25275_c0_g1_i1.p1  ORF type:complete len:172 (-),score=31.98 TRINITY_DN25275_c0_g1_i1:116-631(-)